MKPASGCPHKILSSGTTESTMYLYDFGNVWRGNRIHTSGCVFSRTVKQSQYKVGAVADQKQQFGTCAAGCQTSFTRANHDKPWSTSLILVDTKEYVKTFEGKEISVEHDIMQTTKDEAEQLRSPPEKSLRQRRKESSRMHSICDISLVEFLCNLGSSRIAVIRSSCNGA